MIDRALLRVPANDFARQWQEIREDSIEAMDRVGRSGWLVLGEEVAAFERQLAAWWGVPHAIAVASGLDALEIALRCAGDPPPPDRAPDSSAQALPPMTSPRQAEAKSPSRRNRRRAAFETSTRLKSQTMVNTDPNTDDPPVCDCRNQN